jgi:hypothetical protein
MRRRIAAGVERLCRERPDRAVLTAAIPVDSTAVETARPALEQLATALRSRESLHPRGVALTHVLLTAPHSSLYEPASADELYKVAREALLALGPDRAGDWPPDGD